MSSVLLSIKSRNLYGNIGLGCCLLALGASRIAAPPSSAAWGCGLVCAVLLLVVAGFTLRSCISASRERDDEMSRQNAGRASTTALWSTLIAIGVACSAGMAFNLTVDLASSAFVVIGLALVIYGVTFAWLERH